MAGRFKLQSRTWHQIGLTLGASCLLVFIFCDRPIQLPRWEAAAQATEQSPEAQQESSLGNPGTSAEQIALPAHFQAEWKNIRLDGQIPLRYLSRTFSIKETQAGSEFYDYAASLFEQISQGVSEKELARQLQTLSLQAQTLGYGLHQAASLSYDGPPSKSMTHLQVRANLLQNLTNLNPKALVTERYDQQGKLLHREQHLSGQHGTALNEFLDTTERILQDPSAARYPQAMQLIRKQREVLVALAEHATIHWESTVYCGKTCPEKPSHFKIYLRQDLSEQALSRLQGEMLISTR